MNDQLSVAWAAGLFEGEGCMTMCGVSRSPRLKLAMTDFDVVNKFRSIVGVGWISVMKFSNYKHGKPHYKDQLVWYVTNKKDIITVVDMFLPYFGNRRMQKAAEILCRAVGTPEEGWDGFSYEYKW